MKIRCLYDSLVPVADLKVHPKNPNKHSESQITRLAQILDYQGFRYPIKVSRLSGFITSGHGRLQAAIKLGLSEVPVNYQEYESEEQEYADLVADNAIAEWAELDLASINRDVMDLGPDFELDLLGIQDFVLEPAEKVAQCDEDEVPEQVPTKSVLGDIYILGNHRLMCGDSTSIDAVEKLMNGEKADAVITDPPYNVGKDYAGEDLDAHDFESLHVGWLSTATTIAKEDAAFYIYFGIKWLWNMADITRRYLHNPRLLVWYRPDGHGAGGGDFFYNFDPIFYGSKSGKFHTKKYDGDFNRDVWIVNKAQAAEGGYGHPTAKPLKVVEAAVLTSTEFNHAALDLFGGSGSTLIACEKTNRKCFMMELDPHYIDVIVSRWCKYTGNKKVIRNGEEIEWETESKTSEKVN